MRAVARIALGILLGLILATLPFVHYRLGGAHHGGADLSVDTGGSDAHHTH
jgi:hypothetical protein